MSKITTVDEYIDTQPQEVADRLSVIRKLFHNLVPNTKESIRYGLPAFTVGKYWLYRIKCFNTIRRKMLNAYP